MERMLGQASDFVWGPYLLIPLLLFTGFFLTIRLRGIQFTQLWHSLWLALVVRKEKDAEGDISHFQALATSSAWRGPSR
jgi:AGCS family alanine or glycine:cation symporter